jgi:hypothetical protein
LRSSGVQEFRSSGVQEFRSSGVQEFRSSGVQEFRSSGVQVGQSGELQGNSYSKSNRMILELFLATPLAQIKQNCSSLGKWFVSL